VAKKTLVVYYSRSGTTRKVAEAIVASLKCDCEEIEGVRRYRGLFGLIIGGSQAARKKCPPIKPPQKDPAQYDVVIIGTPVWASTMASPVRTWLTQHRRKFNNVALFCTMGSSDCGHTFPDMGLFCDADALASMALRRSEVAAQQFSGKLDRFLGILNQ
jgi:flavodoxin